MLAALPLRAQIAPGPLAAPTPANVTPADGTSSNAAAAPVAANRRNDAPPRPRAISSELAAQLSASMPKYQPPPPTPPPKAEEDLPDLREIDKPKNTIVRLPKVVVQGQRPPVFTERNINTKQGLAQIAMRRYLSETDRVLNSFTIPLFSPLSTAGGTSNENRALGMYAEDERLKNMADIADNTNMVMKSGPAAGAQVKSAAQNTFMRWTDFGWNGGGPK